MPTWAKLRRRLPRPGTRSSRRQPPPARNVFPGLPSLHSLPSLNPLSHQWESVDRADWVDREDWVDWVDSRLGLRADAPHESSGQAIDQARCHRVEISED